MKTTPLLLLVALYWNACTPSTPPHQESIFPDGRWIDLTYNFSEETVYWPTSEDFKMDTVFLGETAGGYHYEAFKFCAAEHGGTHLDAPIHFAAGKQTLEEIPLNNLIGEAVVIDVSEKALKNPDYEVSSEDFQTWEATNGQLPAGVMVLIKTGYGKFWPDKIKYMGTAEKGVDAVAKLHFPGLAPEAATWLTTNRNIKAIGLDTPSIDFGQSKLYESHQILFEQNIPAFENVANLEELPIKGSYVIALPMKIKGGSGGPLRIVAFVAE